MSIKTIGIDLAKEVFQIHGTDEHGKRLFNKQLNVAPQRDEHGSTAASTVFKPSLTSTPMPPDGPAARTVAHTPPQR